MRRKTMLAWLALLGLGPGAALAQEPTMPSGSGQARFSGSSEGTVSRDAFDDWISLRDEADLTATASSGATLSDGLAFDGGGYDACGPCGDICAPAVPCGVRRWNDPCLIGAWVHVDFLLWTVSGYEVPPLATTAPPGVLPVPGNAGVAVAFGNEEVDDDLRTGGRIRFGNWLDPTQSIGVEGHFFGLEQEQTHVDFIQPGDGASLGRPFINTANVAGLFFGPAGPGPAVLVSAFDNTPQGDGLFAFEGAVEIDTSSNVYSAGGLLRHFVAEDTGMRADLIGGYRFFRLDEGLLIRGTSITGATASPVVGQGLVFQETDIFDTVNEFHGGEFGMILEREFGDMLSVELISKVALGNVRQEVHLEGFNTITFAGVTTSNPGGLLVQRTNTGNPNVSGTFERDEFAVLPEVNLNVGLQITQQVRATVGWSALYLSNVVRPGHQIDLNVDGRLLAGGDPNQLNPPPTQPQFTFRDTDVWLYGVNFGVEASY